MGTPLGYATTQLGYTTTQLGFTATQLGYTTTQLGYTSWVHMVCFAVNVKLSSGCVVADPRRRLPRV
jgi:hypothetical protein